VQDKIIEKNSEVWAHMTIELMDGSVADSTRVNRKPMVLRLGCDDLSAAFEANILGLKEGAKKEFVLEPEDAFGLPHPANIHRMPRGQFADDLSLRKGLIIEFSQMNGSVLPGVVRDFDDETVTIDFNHPLCGQKLKFKLEVVSIAPHDADKVALF
jgi:FKBP-type peptidyl-prolyl cis-trans isomerase SlpA